MTNPSPIEAVVMRRVRRIQVLRLFINGFVLSGLVLAVALYGIGREVWVARVFQNMPHEGFLAVGRFYLVAFDHTRLPVQLLSVLVLLSLIYLARATAQFISSALTPVRT